MGYHQMAQTVEENYNEAKMRRVLVGHADASLRVIEASYAMAPAAASSPVAQRGVKVGHTEPSPQKVPRKLRRDEDTPRKLPP